MNKKVKRSFLVFSLIIGLKNINAQCNQYGDANPPISQVTGISSQMGGYNLPNLNGYSDRKVVGDFNGDGLDDIFQISPEPSGPNGASSGIFARLFVSNGGGNFNLIWTSAPNLLNLSSGNIDLTDGPYQIVAGNFHGDGKDEVLIYKQLLNGSEGTRWWLIGDLTNPTPTYLGFRHFGSPGSTGIFPVIGDASINSRFYAANLIGDSHDELFSVNASNNSWNIQTFNVNTPSSSNFYSNFSSTSGWIGSWLLQQNVYDDIHFANFDLTTPYDEIFTLRKAGSWAMLQNFNTGTNSFTLKWTDYGNSDFFQNNQCAPYTYNLQFNSNYEVFFGNLDNCDQDIECFIVINNNLVNPVTLEFNSALGAFRCWSVKWPAMPNSENINGTISSFAYSAYERWTSRRYCSSTCLGICCQYTGGQSYITQRNFYNNNAKDGNLSFLLGNFYNNSYWNGFTYPTKDLIVFRNDIGSPAPQQLNGLTFFTNCTPDHMYGNYCPNTSDIAIYHLNGQYLASFNRNTGVFNTTAVKSGRFCMYSLTNAIVNLRGVNNDDDTLTTANSYYSPVMIESNEIDNIELFELKTTPNPTSDKLMINFKSNIELHDNSIELVNVEGKVVYKTPTVIFEGINTFELNVSTLKNGVYFVKYNVSNGENYKAKFIKN